VHPGWVLPEPRRRKCEASLRAQIVATREIVADEAQQLALVERQRGLAPSDALPCSRRVRSSRKARATLPALERDILPIPSQYPRPASVALGQPTHR
jgi:hypothetical protein